MRSLTAQILHFSAAVGITFFGMGFVPLLSMTPAADLETIQRRGHLIIGVKDNILPLGIRTETGELVGFEIDIARRLAAELLGNPDAVTLQPVANQERIAVLNGGQVDLVIARMTLTQARSRLVDFSIPYYLDGTALVTRNPSIRLGQDLRRRRVAVLEGSSTIAVVRWRIPNAQLVGVSSYEAALALLETGQADAFAGDASILTGWVQQYPTYRLLPDIWLGEALAIAMPRGQQYQPLREAVNGAIARWREEGWLDERARYWELPIQLPLSEIPTEP